MCNAVQVSITPPQRIKMGPQQRLGIYVGYNSPLIIKYLEPLMGDLFTVRFTDCHFDEKNFPSMGNLKASKEEKQKKGRQFHLDRKRFNPSRSKNFRM